MSQCPSVSTVSPSLPIKNKHTPSMPSQRRTHFIFSTYFYEPEHTGTLGHRFENNELDTGTHTGTPTGTRPETGTPNSTPAAHVIPASGNAIPASPRTRSIPNPSQRAKTTRDTVLVSLRPHVFLLLQADRQHFGNGDRLPESSPRQDQFIPRIAFIAVRLLLGRLAVEWH